MATLFISDLHLPDQPSPLREGFLRFLQGPARQAQALYILGDLFEYWIGDDVGLVAYATEIAALRSLTDGGVPCFFMHGNRDFLVGEGFSHASGVQLLPDPTLIELDGVPTLLGHGDLWCTDDRGYQRWRRFSRNRLAQRLFLKLPVSRRQAIAGDVRGRSHSDKRYKAQDIMDVNATAIRAAFDHSGAHRLIHGHTHRPADHQLHTGDHRRVQRLVLADWHDDRMEYLSAENGELIRRRLDA